jgi:hypothetical protein
MKIYLAGFGHPVEKTDFVIGILENWNCLLSYYFLRKETRDVGLYHRFNYIYTMKKKKQSRRKN